MIKYLKIITIIIFINLFPSFSYSQIFTLSFDPEITEVNQNSVVELTVKVSASSDEYKVAGCLLRIGFDSQYFRVTDSAGNEITSLTPFRNDVSGLIDQPVTNNVDNLLGRIEYDVLFQDNSSHISQLAKLDVPVDVVKIYFKAIKAGSSSIYFDGIQCAVIYPEPPDYTNYNTEEGPNGVDLGLDIKDVISPVSSVQQLPARQLYTEFEVNWTGADENGTGVKWFDVQYKEGAGGTWQDWKTNYGGQWDYFNGDPGKTYYFRCKATDWVGNTEEWPSNPDYDTYTTISSYTLSKDQNFSIAALPNPSVPDGIIILLSANKDINITISNLSVILKQNEMTTAENITMNEISNLNYAGSYIIKSQYSGKAEIKATYTSDSISKELITYFLVSSVGKLSGNLSDERFKLSYQDDTFEDGTNILILPNQISSLTAKEIDADEFSGSEIIYYLNSSNSPKKAVKISFNYEEIPLDTSSEKLGIYTYQDNSYIYLGGELDKENKTISIITDKFKNYTLLADIREPVVSDFKVVDNTVSAKAIDYGSGLNLSSIKLKIADKEVKTVYDEEKKEIKYVHYKNFYGKQNITLEVEDRVGNKVIISQVFQLPEELLIEKVYSFPNPYMGNTKENTPAGKQKYQADGITFRYKASGELQKVVIEIFNIKGKLIDKFYDETIDGEVNYNFANKLANGVYIYRISISDGKKTRSKTGKIVVLK